MKWLALLPILGCLVVTMALLFTAGCSKEKSADSESPAAKGAEMRPDTADYAHAQMALPRMVDFGKGQCIPCKMMAPFLEELKKEYKGRAIIEVIDIGEHPEEARKYGIRVMPTQIFFDAEGNEVWRHEGFLAKEDIVEKLIELGIEPLAE